MIERPLKFGIVGAGLIGTKRARAIAEMPGHHSVVAVTDSDGGRAQALAGLCGGAVEPNWESLVARCDVDAVIVATSNDAIPVCAMGALRAGKHVLAEKPAGRNPSELRDLVAVAHASQRTLGVGFNHRFHPGFLKAKALIESGALGPFMYLRARYGHGGRLGYEKEWRANPALSGGGELLDQGVHLIDLCRWLGGEFDLEWARVGTFFWDMPVEDNGFLALRSRTGQGCAFLHASCTEWKNLFDFEFFGRDGKIQIFGLGRSYGTEELRFYKMKPEMGPPITEIQSFPGEDDSWKLEIQAFLDRISGRPSSIATGEDALRAIEIVHAAYARNGSSPCSA